MPHLIPISSQPLHGHLYMPPSVMTEEMNVWLWIFQKHPTTQFLTEDTPTDEQLTNWIKEETLGYKGVEMWGGLVWGAVKVGNKQIDECLE